MRRKICLLVTLGSLAVLTGCSGGPVVKENSELVKQESMAEVKEVVVAPTEAEVLAMREVALENMKEDDINYLKNVVKKANISMERDYLYGNDLENMEDPEALAWNYIDKLGRYILVGRIIQRTCNGRLRIICLMKSFIKSMDNM